MKKVKVLSRHRTHEPLRSIELPFPCIVRMGSTTEGEFDGVEINTQKSCEVSGNKLLMKEAFTQAGVKTAKWSKGHNPNLGSPIVAKHIFGSRGTGNYLLKDEQQVADFLERRADDLHLFIFEKYYAYRREYRLHITELGCFYANRKAMRDNTPSEDRWRFNAAQTVWLREENERFFRPERWNEIVEHSIKALKAVGLTIGAIDVKVSAETGNFIILETNSAPSLGDYTKQKYLSMIPVIAGYEYAKKQQHGTNSI